MSHLTPLTHAAPDLSATDVDAALTQLRALCTAQPAVVRRLKRLARLAAHGRPIRLTGSGPATQAYRAALNGYVGRLTRDHPDLTRVPVSVTDLLTHLREHPTHTLHVALHDLTGAVIAAYEIRQQDRDILVRCADGKTRPLSTPSFTAMFTLTAMHLSVPARQVPGRASSTQPLTPTPARTAAAA